MNGFTTSIILYCDATVLFNSENSRIAKCKLTVSRIMAHCEL